MIWIRKFQHICLQIIPEVTNKIVTNWFSLHAQCLFFASTSERDYVDFSSLLNYCFIFTIIQTVKNYFFVFFFNQNFRILSKPFITLYWKSHMLDSHWYPLNLQCRVTRRKTCNMRRDVIILMSIWCWFKAGK